MINNTLYVWLCVRIVNYKCTKLLLELNVSESLILCRSVDSRSCLKEQSWMTWERKQSRQFPGLKFLYIRYNWSSDGDFFLMIDLKVINLKRKCVKYKISDTRPPIILLYNALFVPRDNVLQPHKCVTFECTLRPTRLVHVVYYTATRIHDNNIILSCTPKTRVGRNKFVFTNLPCALFPSSSHNPFLVGHVTSIRESSSPTVLILLHMCACSV